MDRHAVASFARFVVCGGGVGLLSSGALLLMTGVMSIAVANAVVTVVSTAAANELHSRITFRHGAAGLRVHLESTATAVAAYLVTTGALLTLGAVHPEAGALTQQSVYLTASALAGIGRFVALKVLVFARGAKSAEPLTVRHAARHANTPAQVVAAA
ncbi:hypothetical protein [Yinghuangia sp. YIM S09857]|uniref:hypothetical protein n=1 Tax=Yinghuangia sp. YIM S09857 TaxID=3436929 RepID=UPI003F52FF45